MYDLREELLFQDFVASHFGFIQAYGLELIDSNPYCVKYASERHYLYVWHEGYSHEIGVSMGMLPYHADNNLHADLQEILELESNDNNQSCYSAWNKSAVENGVKYMAELVKKHGQKALEGNVEYFLQFPKIREESMHRSVEYSKFKSADDKAIKAFKAGDYKSVVKAYKGFEDRLNKIQQKKLDIAKRKAKECSLFKFFKA